LEELLDGLIHSKKDLGLHKERAGRIYYKYKCGIREKQIIKV